MSSTLLQFLKTENDVETAAYFVAGLMEPECKRAGSKDAASRNIARQAKVPPSLVRDLSQESRRPKAIRHRCFMRLWRAYTTYVRGRLDELRHELTLLDAVGPCDATVQTLRSEVAAIAREIEALSGTVTSTTNSTKGD